MTDKDLIQYATDFRSGLLGDLPSDRMCFAVCSPLAGLLAVEGVEAELVESNLTHTNHVWLRLPDGRALDPTADQFGDPFPPVYLGPPTWIHADPDSPPSETQLTGAGAELVDAALEWIGAEGGREKANARARFKRRVEKHSRSPFDHIRLWSYAVGIAKAILSGDMDRRDDQIAYTEQGARKLAIERVGIL